MNTIKEQKQHINEIMQEHSRIIKTISEHDEKHKKTMIKYTIILTIQLITFLMVILNLVFNFKIPNFNIIAIIILSVTLILTCITHVYHIKSMKNYKR